MRVAHGARDVPMAKPTSLPSWSQSDHWRDVYAALSRTARPPDPLQVQEEWRCLAGKTIHVDRWLAPGARAKIILLHGSASHGRIMGALAWRLALFGYETLCPDLPGLGLSFGKPTRELSYDDWREVAAELIEQERARGADVFIYGHGLGGLLAYDAVSLTGIGNGLVFTHALDPSRADVVEAVLGGFWRSRLTQLKLRVTPRALAAMPAGRGLVGEPHALTRDAKLRTALMNDPHAGAAHLSSNFVQSWLNATPLHPPESFSVCPVLFLRAGADAWAPPGPSEDFYARLNATKRRVRLDTADFFNLSGQGADLHDHALSEFLGAICDQRPIPERLV